MVKEGFDFMQQSITQQSFLQQNFAVIGLGDTGASIINYLGYQQANLLKIFDTRTNPPNIDKLHLLLSRWYFADKSCDKKLNYEHKHNNKHNIELFFGELNWENFANIDVIVISPGVSIYEPVLQLAIKHNKQVVGDVELFARLIKPWQIEGSKVIGITGSNGKTTVTTLMGHLAHCLGINVMVAGNIGTPVLDAYIEYDKFRQKPDLIVLELSSFQLETTYSLDMDAATVLNISEDHMDRYRDLLEYAYVKANIFNNCKTQVLNYDDIWVRGMKRHRQQQLYFGVDAKNSKFVFRDGQLQVDGVTILDANLLQLVGVHNYLNCLASLALLSVIGVEVTNVAVIAALTKFQGVVHRMQKIAVHNKVTFIEDSKGTNVGAVVAGVSGLSMPVHLILGGDGKGQDFTLLHDLVKNKCKSVAVIGQDATEILTVLTNCGIPLIKQCKSLVEAVEYCYQNATSGDAVVLSPACASWDMFDNYKHRAEVFVSAVEAIINREHSSS